MNTGSNRDVPWGAPNLIKVDSLKINVTDTVNDNPVYLSDTQYLIVGQHAYTNGTGEIYNMIVDHEGVMVNAPLTMRSELSDKYALAVDGNVYVSGEIIAGSSNFAKLEYDPLGLFDCASMSNIPAGTLVEVVGYSNSIIQVQPASTEFSTAIFGVCTNSVLGDSVSGINGSGFGAGGAGSWGGDPTYPWKTQVQTAGIATIKCQGPVNVGDMLTSTALGLGQQTIINGHMVDTAVHNYTIAKALQSVPDGSVATIRCLMNVIKAPPVNRGDGYWELGSNESENIYYPGYVTIGGDYASRCNMYSLNIVESADRTIEHSQLNIENTQTSQLRLGIVGTGATSPAVVNSGPATPIEFHAARNQTYFQKMYTASNWTTIWGINGSYTRSNVVTPAEVPDYVNYASRDDAPHMIIGTDGNVGIHTSANPPLTFKIRTTANAQGVYPTVTQTMALHVQGNTFASNMLIWDYETATPKNIDDLYVRRLGVTFPAINVIPGPFALGGYYYQCNLGVAGMWDSNLALKVWDNSAFTKSVTIGDTLTVQNMSCVNAAFQSDVTAYNDIIVAGSIRLEGGIFVSVLDSEDIYGTKHYTWQAVNFNVAGASSNQFNNVGQGLSTPGRLGVGIGPRDYEALNSLRSEFVINKRTPNSGHNLWEVEIKDLSTTRFTPAAWIGHPLRLNSIRGDDASLVIATPARADPNYAGVYYSGIDTNIYFYPGKGSLNGVDGTIPPVLGVFDERVGVQTFNPQSELHVNGTITFTNNLKLYNPDTKLSLNIGLWVANNYDTPVQFSGLEYKNTDAPYVGINVAPEYGIGVTVGSNLKVYGSVIDGTNSKLAYWYDGSDSNTVNVTNPIAPASNSLIYTWESAGVGIKQPKGEIDIKNNYGGVTTLRIIPDDSIQQTSIEMFGNSGTWKTYTDNITRRLDIGYDTSNIPVTPIDPNIARPMWMQWNTVRQSPQTFIGCPLTIQSNVILNRVDPAAALIVNGGASVIGDVKITGNYYANGFIALNYNSNIVPASNLGVDDVYIGGGNVILNPDGKNSIILGNPASIGESITQGGAAMFRVYQSHVNPLIAEFHTNNTQGLISITSTTGKQLKFGVLDPTSVSQYRSPFAFMDEQNQPYLAFNRSIDGTTNKYVGFNTWNPQAIMHVTSQGIGSNMFRLTTTVADQSTTAACPQITMEKAYANTTPSTVWNIAGPNSAYRQKLSLLYSDATTSSTELFTFTNNSYLGIGTTTPQYGVDVFSTGSQGGLRVANSGSNATPQIVLQAQDPGYSNGILTNYRMYTNSNHFYLDAQAQGQSVIPIYNVDDSGHIGFRMTAASNYDVTVKGVFNVTDAILLNGVPLFSTDTSIAQDSAYLKAVNVYLIPDPINFGGVCINVPTTVKTDNLIYVAGGMNKNMIVYDSPYNEAQMHFRTHTSDGTEYDMWRIGTQDSNLYFEFWQNCGCNLTVDDTHDPYSRAFTIGVNGGTDGTYDGCNVFTATINGSLCLPYSTSQFALGNTTFETNTRDNLIVSSTNLQVVGTSLLSNILTYVTHNGAACGGVDVNGNVGIATSAPRAALDVASGQIFGAVGSVATPTYSFAMNTESGLSLSNTSSVVVSANGSFAGSFNDTTSGVSALVVPSLTATGSALMGIGGAFNVTANGKVGIFTGSNGPQYPIHINCNVVFNGALIPQQSGAAIATVGSTSNRWNKGYFSSGIDINGALLSNTAAGDLWTNIGVSTPRVLIPAAGGSGPTTTITSTSTAISVSGLSFSTTSGLAYYPVVSRLIGGGLGDTGTDMSSLNLKTCNVDPLTAYTVAGSNVAAFHSFTKSNILMVKGNGNVGVGTAAPTSPLTVIGSNASGYTFLVNSQNNGAIASFIKPGMTTDAGLYVSSNAYVGIGASNPQAPLHVNGQAYVQGNFIGMSNMYVNNDLIVAGNTYTHFDQIVDSDIRLKSNLTRIENALDKVCALTGYTYDMAGRDSDIKRSTGLVAQDVLEVLPEAVGSNERTGYYGLEYGSMMGLIVQAIKELREELRSIKE
jgi:hypothetical protein